MSPATGQFSVDLEAGAYSLKLYGAYSGEEPKKASNYRVKLSFIPTENNETEPNDSFTTAMALAYGTLVRGFFSEDAKWISTNFQ